MFNCREVYFFHIKSFSLETYWNSHDKWTPLFFSTLNGFVQMFAFVIVVYLWVMIVVVVFTVVVCNIVVVIIIVTIIIIMTIIIRLEVSNPDR